MATFIRKRWRRANLHDRVAMLIGIDAAPLQAPQSGIPVFARMLLSAIAAERPGWRFTAFGWSGWTPVDAARLTERPSGDNTSEALRARLVSTALGLPLLPAMRRAVRRRLFEILPLPPLDFHYALQFLPMGAIDAPVLPVIHDLAHLALPHLVHPSRRRFLDRLPDVARGAARVQAVSQFTADDVSTRFGVPRDRIDVVTPSLRTLFFEPAQTEPLTALGLAAGRYFLAAGMAEPRKNLDLLLEIAAGESSPIAPDFPLVLTGAPAWKRGKAAQTLQRLEASGAVRP
ncbi:MAG TPA: glycosyltransferase, partial [Rhizobiaceae bacterium]|nr:glycosyltransferase [Rhizobiaceae bacterium]